jgi:hypothetical protein
LRRPVQSLYLMTAPCESAINHQVAEFAWRLKNQVRPLGLRALGLPCQLMGTGMAFPWDIIRSAELASGFIVEDLKLGLDLADAGHPPVFCPEGPPADGNRGAFVVDRPLSVRLVLVSSYRRQHFCAGERVDPAVPRCSDQGFCFSSGYGDGRLDLAPCGPRKVAHRALNFVSACFNCVGLAREFMQRCVEDSREHMSSQSASSARTVERRSTRVMLVDTAKRFGIILVVFGHALRGLVSANVMTWAPAARFVDVGIYAFQMPLFFFLSGVFPFRSTIKPWPSDDRLPVFGMVLGHPRHQGPPWANGELSSRPLGHTAHFVHRPIRNSL